jgi:hypothetical protein
VQVTNNARSNLFLRALSNVLENSSLRLWGNSSCLDLAYAMVFRLGWQTAIVLVLLLIAAPNLLFLLLRSMLERWCDHISPLSAWVHACAHTHTQHTHTHTAECTFFFVLHTASCLPVRRQTMLEKTHCARHMQCKERALFAANAGKAATYENQFFCYPGSPGAALEDPPTYGAASLVCYCDSGGGAGQGLCRTSNMCCREDAASYTPQQHLCQTTAGGTS